MNVSLFERDFIDNYCNLESLLDTGMMNRLTNEKFDIGISEFFDVSFFVFICLI